MPVLMSILLLLVGACAPAITYISTGEGNKCVEAGRWMAPKTGAYATPQSIIKNAAGHSIVLLGEVHTNPNHHIWQLQTISQIYLYNPNMILGFESFPRSKQDILDKWVQGKLSEKEFIDQSGWDEFWRFDKNLYMGLFNFARINHIEMVALNVERELINSVSKNGWAQINEGERHGISTPSPAKPEYVNMLAEVYKDHKNDNDKDGQANPTTDDQQFKNFVDAQLTWDRAFAEAISTKIKSPTHGRGNPIMVNIIGRGHVDYGFGVIEQLKSMGITDVVSFVPWDNGNNCDQIKQENIFVADAIFGTPKFTEPAHATRPKLGVLIEQGNDGVLVKDVAEKSIAANAGIIKGDLIVEAAGKKISNPSELISIVNGVLPGTLLPLKIVRNKRTIEKVAKFTLTNFHKTAAQ